MKVEEIAEAIAKLPPDQLARFRRWFNAFEAGRADHAKELDSTATKLGRLAGRAFAELKARQRTVTDATGLTAISTRTVFVEPATRCVLSAKPPKNIHLSQQRWQASRTFADYQAHRCANATLQNIFR